MFYSELYKPRPSDYTKKGKISFEAILQIMESVADNHSESVGDSVAEANKKGIAWILTEWRVKIIRRPENGEKLHVTTWIRGKAPASIVYRDFLITDENGSDIIEAEAKFALFDLNTKSLVRVDEELFMSYQPEKKNILRSSDSASIDAISLIISSLLRLSPVLELTIAPPSLW